MDNDLPKAHIHTLTMALGMQHRQGELVAGPKPETFSPT
jgi:hypothetical protein